MRLLGLDVGDRRIGIALSDELALTAQGLTVLERRTIQADLDALGQLITHHQVERIIVGIPRNMNGSYGQQAIKTQQFLEALKASCQLPCIPWDERLTSQQAERTLRTGSSRWYKQKGLRDKIAAQLILQNYLDYQRLATARSTS